MTRETRVGMVVTASFLSLVGVVVANKMRGPAEDTPVVAAADFLEPEEEAKSPAGKGERKNDAAPPVPSIKKAKKPEPPTLPTNVTEEAKPIERTNFEERHPPEESGDPKEKPGDKEGDPPTSTEESSAPPMNSGKTGEPESKAGMIPALPPIEPPVEDNKEEAKKSGRPDTVASSPTEKAVAPPMPPKSETPAKEKKVEPEEGAPIALPPPVEPQAEKKEEAPSALPMPVPVEGEKNEKEGEDGVKTVPAESVAPAPVKSSPELKIVAPPPPETEKSADKVEIPPPTDAGVSPPSAPPGLPVPVDDGMKKAAPEATSPPLPEGPPTPTPDRAAGNPPKVETPGDKLRPEPTPMPVTPPVVAKTSDPRTAPGGQPEVVRFVEEEYRTRAGDSFAVISKTKYGSEEYAEALRLYNRNDALDGPPAVEKDGRLKANEKVAVPELHILEKRYSDSVPRLKPVLGSNEAASTRTEAKLQPVPVAATPVARKGPSYRVPAPGQTFREIARLTLANGDRWRDIHLLNEQHRPEYTVPGGTVLTLPTDAKLDPATEPR